MKSEFTSAESAAEQVMDAHGQQISVAGYQHGQQAIVHTLRALADLIERSEFEFQAEWIH